jgi:hypothetical protein
MSHAACPSQNGAQTHRMHIAQQADSEGRARRAANAAVRSIGGGNCALAITAVREADKGLNYTSSRIATLNDSVAGNIIPPNHAKGSFVDGGAVKVEMRARLPAGTAAGTWPAFWMLPTAEVRGSAHASRAACASCNYRTGACTRSMPRYKHAQLGEPVLARKP